MPSKDPVKNFEAVPDAMRASSRTRTSREIQARVEREFDGGLRVRAGVTVPRARGRRRRAVWVEDGYWVEEPGRGGGTEAS